MLLAPFSLCLSRTLGAREASLQVLDRFEHLRHEGGSRPDKRRAHGSGAHANRRVVRTEATRGERVVGELVAVTFFFAAAGGRLHTTRTTAGCRRLLRERRGRERENKSCCNETEDEPFHGGAPWRFASG